MKQLLLICLFSFCAFSQADAQICTADQTFADSTFGVYPPPADPANPESGVYESACINSPYYFSFTFVVPDSIHLTTPFVIDAAIIDITVTGLEGLPAGLVFSTNPSNGIFTPADVLGCGAIYGTATSSNMVGDYELTIQGTIAAEGIPPVPFSTVLDLLGGEGYTLTLDAEGSNTCTISTSTEEAFNDHMTVETAPNPFSDFTNITIKSDVSETLQFRVVNLLGKLVHTETISVTTGDNVINFDGSQLANGVYQFSFSNGADALTQKVVLQK